MALCYREAFPRVSTTVTSQVALRPEFHGRMSNRQAACRLPGPARVVPSSWERRLFVGVLHGCRPSSSVVFCNGCIVAKRYKIGPKLLSITNRKSNTGFQMTLKSMTLDDLERTMVCQSCGIVHTVSRNNQHDMHRARQSSQLRAYFISILCKPCSLNWYNFLITALFLMLTGMLQYRYFVIALKIIINDSIICFCLQTPAIIKN